MPPLLSLALAAVGGHAVGVLVAALQVPRAQTPAPHWALACRKAQRRPQPPQLSQVGLLVGLLVDLAVAVVVPVVAGLLTAVGDGAGVFAAVAGGAVEVVVAGQAVAALAPPRLAQRGGVGEAADVAAGAAVGGVGVELRRQPHLAAGAGGVGRRRRSGRPGRARRRRVPGPGAAVVQVMNGGAIGTAAVADPRDGRQLERPSWHPRASATPWPAAARRAPHRRPPPAPAGQQQQQRQQPGRRPRPPPGSCRCRPAAGAAARRRRTRPAEDAARSATQLALPSKPTCTALQVPQRVVAQGSWCRRRSWARRPGRCGQAVVHRSAWQAPVSGLQTWPVAAAHRAGRAPSHVPCDAQICRRRRRGCRWPGTARRSRTRPAPQLLPAQGSARQTPGAPRQSSPAGQPRRWQSAQLPVAGRQTVPGSAADARTALDAAGGALLDLADGPAGVAAGLQAGVGQAGAAAAVGARAGRQGGRVQADPVGGAGELGLAAGGLAGAHARRRTSAGQGAAVSTCAVAVVVHAVADLRRRADLALAAEGRRPGSACGRPGRRPCPAERGVVAVDAGVALAGHVVVDDAVAVVVGAVADLRAAGCRRRRSRPARRRRCRCSRRPGRCTPPSGA